MLDQGTARRATLAAVLALFLPGRSAAGDGKFTVEGFGGVGSGAKTGDIDFDAKFSGGGGIGYEVAKNLQIRADAAAFSWDGGFTRAGSNVGVCFVIGNTRICFTGSTPPADIHQELKTTPVFVGGRYFFRPREKKVRPFFEAGLGINPVKVEYTTTPQGRSATVAEEKGTKIGGIPGAGLEFKASKSIGIGVGARYYLVPKGVGGDEEANASFFAGTASLVIHF